MIRSPDASMTILKGQPKKKRNPIMDPPRSMLKNHLESILLLEILAFAFPIARRSIHKPLSTNYAPVSCVAFVKLSNCNLARKLVDFNLAGANGWPVSRQWPECLHSDGWRPIPDQEQRILHGSLVSWLDALLEACLFATHSFEQLSCKQRELAFAWR